MSDLIDRISDQEEKERERKRRVGSRSTLIFRSLMAALKDRVSRYNDRNPHDFGFPDALLIQPSQSACNSTVKIEKTSDPKASLMVDFPINSGAMGCTFVFGPDQFSETIKLDSPTRRLSSTSMERAIRRKTQQTP